MSIVEGSGPINALPEDNLRRIVSFLPLKDALRMASVTRGWRHLWTSVVNLDFDQCGASQCYCPRSLCSANCAACTEFREFLDQVDRTLALHNAPKIARFHLSFRPRSRAPTCFNDRVQSRADYWIQHALAKGVEELDVSTVNRYTWPTLLFELGGRSIKRLTLCGGTIGPAGSSIGFGSLRSLTLKSISFGGVRIGSILGSCPLLEFLCIDFVSILDGGKLYLPSLRTLKLRCFSGGDMSGMCVHAPKLELLDYEGRVDHLSFRCTPSPADVVLNIVNGVGVVEPLKCACCMKFLHDMRHAQSLTLLNLTSQPLRTLAYAWLSQLHNLKHLKIAWIMDELDYSKMGYLLSCFPNLETVSLQVSKVRSLAPSNLHLTLEPCHSSRLEKFTPNLLNYCPKKGVKLEVFLSYGYQEVFCKKYEYDNEKLGGWIHS